MPPGKTSISGSGVPSRKELEKQFQELKALAVKLEYDNKLLRATTTELIAANKKARESDKSKSAFLANMSHEIRTPMNGILGFAELLKKPGLPAEKHKLFIEIIEQSGHRMLNIINDIIDVSKIEAGLAEVCPEEVNLNSLLRQLYDFFTPEAHKSDVSLYLHTPLPDERAVFLTDPQKMEQIISNLIKNSLKFIEKGRIDFGYAISGSQLTFYVKDTGIGISSENLKNIFNRFWKKDIRQNKEYDGSGLGLTISRSFAEMMGGKIWVESERGKGSEFYISFPMEKCSPADTGKSTAEGTPGIIKSHKRGLKILIAEDDPVSEEYLKAVLEPWVSEIIIACTGSEAVRLCRENPDTDIILMDIRMAGMDGLQATRKIRKFNNKIPVIAQTAYALEGDREMALKAGCTAYITKPLKSGKLREIISKFVH